MFINNNFKLLVQEEEKGKSKKLKDALKLTEAELIAFLDADHRALPDWLSLSVKCFSRPEIAAVQSRRFSLGSENPVAVWDTAENHLAQEVINKSFTALNLNIFLTGTTFLIRKEIIDKFGFSQCITEDTYLSYQIITNEYKIVYCGQTGSYEESVHKLRDYLNRKRRWSAGHNQVMFKFFPKIFSLKPKKALQLFFHSQFFLLPLLILFYLLILGYHYFIQYPLDFSLKIFLFSLLPAFFLANWYSKEDSLYVKITNFIVGFLLIFPLFLDLARSWFYFIGSEFYFQLLSFPLFLGKERYLIIGTLIAPFIPPLSGLFIFKPKQTYKYFINILTIPFFFFFNLYGCLLGFLDLVFKKAGWKKTARSKVVIKDEVKNFKKNIFTTKVRKSKNWRWLLIIPAFFIFILINDALCTSNCGEVSCKILKQPVLFSPKSRADLSFNIKRIGLAEATLFKVAISVSPENLKKVDFKLFLDGEEIASHEITNNVVINTEFKRPFGFTKHELKAQLKGEHFLCERKKYLADSLIEVKGKKLYLNGEPFLVKCVISSFSSLKTNLSLKENLNLIKESGANTLRTYHTMTEKMLGEIGQEFMYIQQPNKSTWKEVDLKMQKSFLKRIEVMDEAHEGSPYFLIRILGNEWDLLANEVRIEKIKEFLSQIIQTTKLKYPPFSYSTYRTYLEFPGDIKAINMLDDGKIYWSDAVGMIANTEKPVLASELGGFVAFSETINEEARAERIKKQWNTLMENNFIGACIHQSHDNWAQAIPQGFNDPTKPEQPDDLRGIYDINNNPKESFYAVQKIFNDFDYQLPRYFFNQEGEEMEIILKNKRDYKLDNVILTLAGIKPLALGLLIPGEKKPVEIPIFSENQKLELNYSTHSGLKEKSVIYLPIKKLKETPNVFSKNVRTTYLSKNKIEGYLTDNDEINILLKNKPQGVFFNQQKINFSWQNNILTLKPSIKPIVQPENWQFSENKLNWLTIDEKNMWPTKEKRGFYKYEFETNSIKTVIKVEGTAGPITLWINDKKLIPEVHFYRPNYIDISKYIKKNNVLMIEFFRNEEEYVKDKVHIKLIPLLIYQELPFSLEFR